MGSIQATTTSRREGGGTTPVGPIQKEVLRKAGAKKGL